MLYSKIKSKLERQNMILYTTGKGFIPAYGCGQLLHEVLSGATENQMQSIYDCSTLGCSDLNDVISHWYKENLLPRNKFRMVYQAYDDNNYNQALYYLMRHFGRIDEDRVLCTNFEPLTVDSIKRYTEFIPDEVMRELVQRCMFDNDLGDSELLMTNRTISEWFAYCAKKGWLSFEPYVYNNTRNPTLVLKYNRILRFDDCWGIYSSRHNNSFWYKGVKFSKNVWRFKNKYFVSALMWASFLNVAMRMSEVEDLLRNRFEFVSKYVRSVADSWMLRVSNKSFSEIFNSYISTTYVSEPMKYRLVKDANSDYARMTKISELSGAIEVPNGIDPKTIGYDFSGMFDGNVQLEELRSTGEFDSVLETFICAILALSGIMLDDKSVYSLNKEASLRAGRVDDYFDVRVSAELPVYVD